MLDIKQIMKIMQQRYPFIFIDKVIDYKFNDFSIACKNVTMNEFWVQGHFEGEPIFPGVLLVEAAAQAGAFIFYDKDSEEQRIRGKLSSIPFFKFIRPVVPGDQLMIRAEYMEKFANMAKVRVLVTVDGKRTAEGELTYAFTNL